MIVFYLLKMEVTCQNIIFCKTTVNHNRCHHDETYRIIILDVVLMLLSMAICEQWHCEKYNNIIIL